MPQKVINYLGLFLYPITAFYFLQSNSSANKSKKTQNSSLKTHNSNPAALPKLSYITWHYSRLTGFGDKPTIIILCKIAPSFTCPKQRVSHVVFCPCRSSSIATIIFMQRFTPLGSFRFTSLHFSKQKIYFHFTAFRFIHPTPQNQA